MSNDHKAPIVKLREIEDLCVRNGKEPGAPIVDFILKLAVADEQRNVRAS